MFLLPWTYIYTLLLHPAIHYPRYDAEDRAEYAYDYAGDKEEKKWPPNSFSNGFFIHFCHISHRLIDVRVGHSCLELRLGLNLRHIRDLFFLSSGYARQVHNLAFLTAKIENSVTSAVFYLFSASVSPSTCFSIDPTLSMQATFGILTC